MVQFSSAFVHNLFQSKKSLINMKDYTPEIEKINILCEENNLEEALKQSQLLIEQAPENPQIQYHCSAFLIDCGSVLGNIDSIKQGIFFIEKLLEKLEILKEDKDSRDNIRLKAELTYNLSNGYSAKAYLLNKNFSQKSDECKKALSIQKQLLQKIILKQNELEKIFLADVLANYANLLTDLGRYVEAIDYYYDCLKLYPEHAVAMGNCASVLQRLINLSTAHNAKILYEVWRLFQEANRRKLQLKELAGHHVISQYQNALIAFEEYLSLNIGGSKSLQKRILGWEKAHSWQPSLFLQKLRNDRLLLTVNPRPTNCPSEYKDDVFWGSICVSLEDKDDKWFQSLAYTFNNIKEDFATARYLYYQSLSEETELVEKSRVTHYLQTYDFADFGLRTGLLKTSLRIAIDCLDKCACFLNLYLNLNHDQNKVIWNNVWYSNLSYKKGVHPEIEKRLNSNSALAALHDIKKDMYGNLSIYPYKDLRNYATHQLLVLYWERANEDTITRYNLENFKETTFFLLRMVKAVIIYLVDVVMIEEKYRDLQRQKKGEEGKVAEGLSYEIGVGLSDCDIAEFT
jgi:tetratricopeptide (TPR) repeat protein